MRSFQEWIGSSLPPFITFAFEHRFSSFKWQFTWFITANWMTQDMVYKLCEEYRVGSAHNRATHKCPIQYQCPWIYPNQPLFDKHDTHIGVDHVMYILNPIRFFWSELPIRRKMREIMAREAQPCDLEELVAKSTNFQHGSLEMFWKCVVQFQFLFLITIFTVFCALGTSCIASNPVTGLVMEWPWACFGICGFHCGVI